MKYPYLPIIDAVISWSDDKRYKGIIHFQEAGKSGGNSHGDGKRKDTGNQIHHKDYRNVKTRFLYRFYNFREW